MTYQERLSRLPQVMVMDNGMSVTDAIGWNSRRRPELLHLFQKYIFGYAPIGKPDTLSFDVTSAPGIMNGEACRKQVTISYEGPGGLGKIDLLIFIPTVKLSNSPFPVFLLLNNRSQENADPERTVQSPFWPAEEIVKRGYAAAVIQLSQLDPDYDDGFRNGVHGIFGRNSAHGDGSSWATISAWAWGASRVMDYFESDKDIDSSKVAVVGHSRGGKTSLWAGALDQRFALTISNNSGCTGAAISRGKVGETIAAINKGFPHWFCDEYKRYDHREFELPVDQHELLALIAPRLLYVTSASNDTWADPDSEFLSCLAAEPVYSLLGVTGLGQKYTSTYTSLPAPNQPVGCGNVRYHVRTGDHDLTLYDWSRFMDFADEKF